MSRLFSESKKLKIGFQYWYSVLKFEIWLSPPQNLALSHTVTLQRACPQATKTSGSGIDEASGCKELVLAAPAPAAAPAAAAADKLPRALTPISRQPPLNEKVAI